MLLYHFPLTSNSSTPNLENKGLKNDYTLESGWTFEQEGKLSSYCARTNKKRLVIPISGDFTLCFRVKSKIVQYNWSRMVVFFNQQDESSFSILYSEPNHSLNYGVYANTTNGVVKNIFEVDDNKWHDIIVTRSNGLIMFYVDSLHIGTSQDNGTSLITMFYLAIDSRQAWDCYLQDIRIYDYCLSQQEIKDYSKALVLHYPLNGSELGNTIKDVSGLGNDGGLVGDIPLSEDSPRGSKSMNFPKSATRYIRRGSFGFLQKFTWSCWIYQTDRITVHGSGTTTKQHFLSQGRDYRESSTHSYGFNLYSDNGTLRVMALNTNGTTGFKMNLNQWYQIVATYDGIAIKIYVNGELIYTKADSIETLWYYTQAFMIGKMSYGYTDSNYYYPFVGDISDVRVYATALSEQDIKDLYNAPINFDKTTMNGIELSENAKYKSFAWRTPTYDEMNYIINTRPNASNLRGLGRVNVNGNYVNGCFLLPDDFVAPEGITFTPTTANYTTNSYTLEQFRKLEEVGVVFFPAGGYRYDLNMGLIQTNSMLYVDRAYYFNSRITSGILLLDSYSARYNGFSVRLIKNSQQGKFSTSATTKIEFAPTNLQYHCLKKIWRFAPNQYDYIGQANLNISDTYNGWIDLFGYGTSGVNYSPTLHSNKSAYASGNISGTQNDWGVNEIVEPSYLDYDNKFHKTGIIKANEISEKLVYPSKYWRTPTYDEMNYIINTRTNASNLKSLGRVLVNGSYKSGCFLLPDNYNIPEGITFVPNVFNATDLNSYNYEQFTIMNDGGVVFIPFAGGRNGANMITYWYFQGLLTVNSVNVYRVVIDYTNLGKGDYYQQNFAKSVRLVHSSQQGKFSTPTGNIDFAPANLQYHCTKHIWRFAEHQYDFIGSANANIADTYDGWIDLFGYGTSGVNYSPTLHSTNKSDYASGDISNTDNDWGVNEIEYRETGFYKDKIRFNKIKEI